MLRVNYKNKYGYYKTPEGTKIYICESNCMWAEIYIYKNDEGKKKGQLNGFFADSEHLKRFIDNLPERFVGYKFVFSAANINKSFEKKELWKSIQIITEHGAQVVIK